MAALRASLPRSAAPRSENARWRLGVVAAVPLLLLGGRLRCRVGWIEGVSLALAGYSLTMCLIISALI
jgi:hypothetical protein